MSDINIIIEPRRVMTWNEFVEETPKFSIALDGMVLGGPRYDSLTKHVNFDHHDNVLRSATMSTCRQVEFALNGDLFESFRDESGPKANIYINDTDQDTTLAVFQLVNYKLFEGTKTIPSFNRLLNLTDKLDITGGGYKVNLDEKLLRQHDWIFEPYANLRKSGALSSADENILRDNLESMLFRINKFIMGQAGEKAPDIKYNIIEKNDRYWMIEELGGPETRYKLFSQGMNAFISLLSTMPDGRKVYSIGRRSQYIDFPVSELIEHFNKYEDKPHVWGGSTDIGGSRNNGSSLSFQDIKRITDEYLTR